MADEAAETASEAIADLEVSLGEAEALHEALTFIDCTDEAYLWASDDCTGDIGYIVNKPNADFPRMKVGHWMLGAFDN